LQKKYILAIDQGTTGSRAVLFDNYGKIIVSAYKEFRQYFPKPGWVEQDPDEIWASCVNVIKRILSESRINQKDIAAIGITNQRETSVIWERSTSRPLARAIVWQCRRTADTCRKLRQKGFQPLFRKKTGLVLDPYFSGTKIKWFLDNLKGLRQKAESGKICFGTIDSWLVWKLTGGKAHATDVTNASRTLVFNIKELKWDDALLEILNIPKQMLARVNNSGSIFGVTANNSSGLISGIPIAAVMGDQQAALYGQDCFSPGEIKNTYGTGCFMVLNTGKKIIYSKKGLLSTIACDEKGYPVYALEGSIFVAGALIQWFRDEMRLIKNSAESEKIIQGIKDTKEVYIVPAFVGLGAPYWAAHARGLITGLTRGCGVRHIVRAGLEAIAYQTKDVFGIMEEEFGQKIKKMKVDGGAAQNNFLMQFQADILNCRIIRPRVIESTVRGAAYLAGITAGLWNKKDLQKIYCVDKVFSPAMSPEKRKKLYAGWQSAVKMAICGVGKNVKGY